MSEYVLPLPSPGLLNGSSLFLDLDGTLFDLVDDPASVVADAAARGLLGDLSRRLDGRLAIVTGRSLAQVDMILGEQLAASMAVTGSHGCEHRWQGVLSRPNRPATLDAALERLRPFAHSRPGLLVEDKSYGVALHYRMNPTAEEEALAIVTGLAGELGLAVQRGKLMVELRIPGSDKGRAVHRLMGRAPMAGGRPLFIGDDLTDEPGFAAARELDGHGILVGKTRPSAADFALPGPADLRVWLTEALE